MKPENKMRFLKKNISKIARVSAAILLILALWRNPYTFYVALRWVICAIAIYSAWCAVEFKGTFWFWCFCIIAVIFNPIIPIHLKRQIWRYIDIISAVMFTLSVPLLRAHSYKLTNEDAVEE